MVTPSINIIRKTYYHFTLSFTKDVNKHYLNTPSLEVLFSAPRRATAERPHEEVATRQSLPAISQIGHLSPLGPLVA